MNLANLLTFGRLIVSPIVFVLYYFGDSKLQFAGLIVFVLGAISDFWDGYIARKIKAESYWGKLWDPIADKCLTSFALVALSSIGLLPWWVTVALILRDVAITTLRLVRLQTSGGIILPVFAAKLKTTFEFILLTSLLAWKALLQRPLGQTLETIVIAYSALLIILSWGTGIHYLLAALRKKESQ